MRSGDRARGSKQRELLLSKRLSSSARHDHFKGKVASKRARFRGRGRLRPQRESLPASSTEERDRLVPGAGRRSLRDRACRDATVTCADGRAKVPMLPRSLAAGSYVACCRGTAYGSVAPQFAQFLNPSRATLLSETTTVVVAPHEGHLFRRLTSASAASDDDQRTGLSPRPFDALLAASA